VVCNAPFILTPLSFLNLNLIILISILMTSCVACCIIGTVLELAVAVSTVTLDLVILIADKAYSPNEVYLISDSNYYRITSYTDLSYNIL
jgi:hypothetical protein